MTCPGKALKNVVEASIAHFPEAGHHTPQTESFGLQLGQCHPKPFESLGHCVPHDQKLVPDRLHGKQPAPKPSPLPQKFHNQLEANRGDLKTASTETG